MGNLQDTRQFSYGIPRPPYMCTKGIHTVKGQSIPSTQIPLINRALIDSLKRKNQHLG